MDYTQGIRTGRTDPKSLEDLYRAARQQHDESRFRADLLTCYGESPGNILYAAWAYRLQDMPPAERTESRLADWKWAVPLGLAAGIVFAVLSLSRFDLPAQMPFLALVWAPIGACFIIAFLVGAGGRDWSRAAPLMIGLVAFGVYVSLWVTLGQRQSYLFLMALHLPVLAWIGVGLAVVGLRSTALDRQAFLAKSLEVIVTGGLYVIAGGAFAVITLGLFQALGIQLPLDVIKLLIAGGGGLITVLAVATVYDPRASAAKQRFEQGLGRLITIAGRLLLPLTLVMLVIYVLLVPFNFMEPFRNRDVLVVYNAMLFAVMGLLVGVTPVNEDDLPARYHSLVRAGILAVASLTVLVSLYALSATLYRTSLGGITVNRLAVIGWNLVNIGVLALLVAKQVRGGRAGWIRSLHESFSVGAVAYALWTLFLILAVPVLFGRV